MNKKEILLMLKKLIEQSKKIDYECEITYLDPNRLLKTIDKELENPRYESLS